ncbi:acyl-CoA dehydrogenase family protein [Nocardia sp. XZ_19_369]|uniref:acyl-CoA dehydrogenase family protein n=1 Tax=Nocardia sp. XZ_19_369 TaxID=2769487 RepID=UPI0027D2EBF9|nr:acyl-CoA dehydrogenase family protein [Nocardia sp. XZ_19_369]
MTGVEAIVDVDAVVAAAATDAASWEHTGLPAATIALMARGGLLAPDRPKEFGGHGVGAHELGTIAARLGSACTSVRSLFTVQGMVAAAVDRWGTADQRARWLPAMTDGSVIAGLAATESNAGSDLSGIHTTFERDGAQWRLSGRKLWVTFGAVADVLLVLGRGPAGPMVALVRTDRPGLTVEPVHGQLGMRGARIAHIALDRVVVPDRDVLGRPGFGLSHLIATALDHGRYTIAWGCLGMAQACLADSREHAARRAQGSVVLADHETVRATLGRSWVDVASARALCERAADQRAAREPAAILGTVVAKYAAARAAAVVSERAVQLLGAAGCAPDSRAGRYFRDAKIMQIIEGAREVAELDIGDHVLRAPIEPGGAPL